MIDCPICETNIPGDDLINHKNRWVERGRE